MNMEIRIAEVKHLKKIQNLNHDLCKKEKIEFDKTINSQWPFSDEGEEYFKKKITGDYGCTFIAVLNEEIIGYLVGGLRRPETYREVSNLAELESIFIIENYRSSGVGQKLYEVFINWCKTKKVKRVKVVASAQNEGAIRFYQKNNFNLGF